MQCQGGSTLLWCFFFIFGTPILLLNNLIYDYSNWKMNQTVVLELTKSSVLKTTEAWKCMKTETIVLRISRNINETPKKTPHWTLLYHNSDKYIEHNNNCSENFQEHHRASWNYAKFPFLEFDKKIVQLKKLCGELRT